MLMTAAVHMDSAAHGRGPSYSTSTSPPPPAWFPAGNHRLPCDFTAPPTPSPTPATATAAPPNHHHQNLLRPAGTRRAAKRRPRPSRKLPTTYITADPASFRRMVHQVTGADDLPMTAAPPAPGNLCRPAPYRAGGAAGATMLPTLDTSAFLLGAPGVAAGPAGSVPTPRLDGAEAGGACNHSSNSSSGGFPTLDSWDALF
ncbi:hypothetical protein SEVIR_8G004400v4 [Setaria viridis]|uniref:VQ domain-containing protein n=1 Tax=Setaria viridis TaxID=4556 RepID=A0A4V6Y7W1_SETVI|nr:calmodulin-binding protein 25-like [Setaria viridis]TKV98905.1 hypothetical protein SEVIR_8G004400v2 [Setaria viridis]